MQPISHTPIYNLKAVLRETGLSADVLRAWERRYGLPHPQRTQGRQRLYSQYDIALIKWLKARQAEGLSISRAVEQWKEAIETGQEPLTELSALGQENLSISTATPETQIDLFRQQWVEACLAFDEARANQVANQAFSLYPIETVCTGILQRGLSLIGDRWYHQQASVQQEHFASALATRRLEALIAASPYPTRLQTVLVCCPPGEFHAFPALLLALLLRRKGLKLVYLGADVPVELLTESVSAIDPDLVVLTAQQLTSAASLRQVALQLKASGTQAAYGGWIFDQTPGLRDRIPAHFLGETITSGLEAIDFLCVHPLPVPDASANALAEIAKSFRQKRVLIEAEISNSMQDGLLTIDQMRTANGFFGGDLSAALELGDLSLMDADMEWARIRMIERNLYPDQFTAYLAAYQKAAQKIFGDQGILINQWINDYLKRPSHEKN